MSTLLARLLDLLATWRRPVVVFGHLGLICVSNYLAFLLRFDGVIPDEQAALVGQMLPWLVAVRGLIFVPFRLYEGMWRYASIWDLRNIIAGVGLSSVVFYVLVHYGVWGAGLFAFDFPDRQCSARLLHGGGADCRGGCIASSVGAEDDGVCSSTVRGMPPR